MSRTALGIIGSVILVAGILSVWGHATGWAVSLGSVWRGWLKILIGVVVLIIAVSDKTSTGTDR